MARNVHRRFTRKSYFLGTEYLSPTTYRNMKTTRTFSLSFISFLFVVALLAVWSVIAPGDAAAQRESDASSTSKADSSESAEATVDSKAALVIDGSWSMSEKDVGGGSRMDAAKEASRDLVDSLPETANLGLLAYGMRESNAPDNRDAGCRDIETLVPVGKLDKSEMKAKIDQMTPKGYTPVGNALRAAAEELGDEGERSIILVSDGIDTCAPPPVCEVAKELAGDGFDLTIHTVGFKTDEEASKELECVASAGGGEFLEADDAGSLAESLKFLAQRDAQTYQTAGTEFEYSDIPEDAKWLGEGRYHTKVNAKLQSKPGDEVEAGYYKVAVPEGHNAMISTTVLPQRATSGRARDAKFVAHRVDAINEVEKCKGSYGGAATDVDGKTSGGANWMPEPLIRRITPVDEARGCSQHWTIPDKISFETTKEGQGGNEEEVDVEVVIHFEPIPDEAEVAKYPDGQQNDHEDGPELDFDGAQQIKGGTSFSEAVEVKPGAYKDAIVPGEYRYYKIPVEYGQRPVFSYRSYGTQDDGLGNLSPMLYSPFRQNIKFESTRPEAQLAGNVIQYRNRDSGVAGDDQANAGYYYVGLGMPQGDEDKVMGVEQPFEIAFDAVGEKTDGPDWRPTDKNGPEPSDTPQDEKGTGSEKGDEDMADEAEAQAQEETDDGGLSTRTIVIAAMGVAALVLIGAIAALIAMLRRR